MNVLEKINTFLRTKGYDLREIKGFNTDEIVCKALNKQEALEALDLYCQLKIPVLGGDVFYLNQNKEIGWTLDNWYFIQMEDEDDAGFLKRSIEESILFINNYNNVTFKNCIFLFDIIYKKHPFTL